MFWAYQKNIVKSFFMSILYKGLKKGILSGRREILLKKKLISKEIPAFLYDSNKNIYALLHSAFVNLIYFKENNKKYQVNIRLCILFDDVVNFVAVYMRR